MTLRRRIGLIVAVTVVTALLFELALSVFILDEGRLGDRPLPPFGAMPHPRQVAWLQQMQRELDAGVERQGPGVFDSELGWTNTPFASDENDVQCITSIGARGRREYAPKIPADKLRIVTFGDSFTYCAEVTDNESWQHQLETRRPDRELPNFGVGGYGTDQALMRMRRKLPNIEANAVLMGINVENIARNVNRYRPLYHPRTAAAVAKPRFLLQDDALRLLPSPYGSRAELVSAVSDGSVLEQVREHEYWFEPKLATSGLALGQLFQGWQAYSRRQPEQLWSHADEEPFRVTLAILEAFHAEALASGASFAAVVISHRETDLGGERFWQPLCDALDARHIPWIDLSITLAPAHAAGESLFQGGHLSARGNELSAIAIESFLDEHL